MKTDAMLLIFGLCMIATGYEISSTGHLFFKGIYEPFTDSTKFVGPLFLVLGCASTLSSAIMYIRSKKGKP